MISHERLRHLLDTFRNCSVAVVGDFFLDKYLDVAPSLDEASLETGKSAHQVTGVRCSPGVAGTVVNNLTALEAGRVEVLGIIGDDGEGFELRQALHRQGVKTKGLLICKEWHTPTYLKPRDCRNPDLDGEFERYDIRNRTSAPDWAVDELILRLKKVVPNVHGVIVVDQSTDDTAAVVSPLVRDELGVLALQYPEKVFWADSRKHCGAFRNILIKANEFEATGYFSDACQTSLTKHDVEAAARSLQALVDSPVIITRGEQGVLLFDQSPIDVPAIRIAGSIDSTGAGDSFSAAAVSALAAGASLTEAMLVGILAASVTSQQLATTGVAIPAQLLDKLTIWKKQQSR